MEVGDVGVAQRGEVGVGDLVALGSEVRRDVVPRLAAAAGEEDAHALSKPLAGNPGHSSDRGGAFYGPRGPGNLGGPPAEQKLYAPFRSTEEARRVREMSERLTRTAFVGA